MHELGMCEGLVAAIEQRAAGRPVARVGVRVGTRLRVVPDAFQTSFGLVAAGGVAEGAETCLTTLPVQGYCRDCGEAVEDLDPLPSCPACGSLSLDTAGGDELLLEWIEYRDGAEGGS